MRDKPEAAQGEIKRSNFKWSEIKCRIQVFLANVRADIRYRPLKYLGQVTLFRTAQQDSTWGWGDIAAHGVELHQIPGHHMNLLRPPQVQILAEKLSAYLAQPDSNRWAALQRVRQLRSHL